MTQEEKELLLADLCGRLPYGVEVEYNNINCEVLSIDKYNEELTIWICTGYSTVVKLEDVKPYLFPLSSMTEEQKNDLTKNLHSNVFVKDEISFWCLFTANMMGEWKKVFEWCVKNHFDICGLIPKGLAIDATGLNIY